MSCIHFQHVSEKESGLVHVNNIFFFSPPPSPYFQPPLLSSSFSNLTIGLQKPWDRIPPLLSCHHRLHLTLWRPCHHKQHNLQQKYPTTPSRRKVPQKKGKPQNQWSQVSLFISFLVLLIISGLTYLRCLFPSRLSRQWQTNRYFFCNLIVCFCWQNKFFILISENSARFPV